MIMKTNTLPTRWLAASMMSLMTVVAQAAFTITTQPADAAAYTAATVSLTVTTEGSGGVKAPDGVRWYFNASNSSGLIAPGMPNRVIELGEKFGRLMNYGDGLYAGQCVGGMYAEAFFTDDMVTIVKAGLRCIPKDSQYAEMVRDLLAWYRKNPDDWEKTWEWIEEKYHKNSAYVHGLCSGKGAKGDYSIDAKLNGAYIIMGLLYGKGDFDKTIVISTRCGQDSDCNPSNAGGILFTTVGFSKLPARFSAALDPTGKFSHTPYDFPKLIEVSQKILTIDSLFPLQVSQIYQGFNH